MEEYHKIDTVFKRDPETKFKRLILGDYSNDAFKFLANNEWVFTEKVDGTNIRVKVKQRLQMPPEPGIEFGGKTDNAQIPVKLIKALQEKFFPLSDKMHEMFPECDACLYGEGYGAGIESGGNYRPDQSFVLFDVNVGGWWLERHNIEDVATKLGLDVVPVIGRGTLDDMVAMAKSGFTSQWGKFKAEGIIARPSTELRDRAGKRIITKIKHRDFKVA